MVREKATVTLDRAKVRDAMALTDQPSMSEVIDLALDRLIRAERLRRDVATYLRHPPTDEEREIGALPVRFDLDDEVVDYDALYGADA